MSNVTDAEKNCLIFFLRWAKLTFEGNAENGFDQANMGVM
jgi:hypothetical protein